MLFSYYYRMLFCEKPDSTFSQHALKATEIYYRSKSFKGRDSFDFALVREADQTGSGGRETHVFRFPVEVR